ncbi:MAG: Fic family protein [Candidatus Babeliales bacterium]|jgi:Fic family protein
MRKTGTYQNLGSTTYFIPDFLPPSNPPLQLTPEILDLYSKTLLALGKLNEIGQRVPNVQRFIKAYIIKEALLSSSIENIHTTMLDVFTQSFEPSKTSKQTQLVINYNKALQVALEMLQQQNVPLVSKVFLAAHQTLMQAGGGDQANPGSYRKQSVRVGNLVPPSAPHIPDLIANLERFINEPSDIPPLIKAGLAHVQFETIHPFLDGNGRIGRLLITLMLIQDDVLQTPILYPSYYFKQRQHEYYQLLDRVRTHGDFEGWTLFYLQAIHNSATDAYVRAKDIENLHQTLIEEISKQNDLVKIEETALKALQYLFVSPVTNISQLALSINKSYNTTQKIITLLQQANVVQEMTSQKRNKLYKFQPYLEILEKQYSIENV